MELDGVTIHVPHLTEYLRVLSDVFEAEPALRPPGHRLPQSSSTGPHLPVGTVLAFESASTTLGLVDAAWLDDPLGELLPLARLLEPCRPFWGKVVHLFDAGVCGVSDYLASLEGIESVVSCDLNWLHLAIGSALIEGRHPDLPPLIREPRRLFREKDGGRAFEAIDVARCFRRPIGDPSKHTFEVRDSHDQLDEIEADTIALAWSDLARSDLETRLLRIGSQVRLGQRLFLSIPMSSTRSPETAARCLDATGFTIEHIDIARRVAMSSTPFDSAFLQCFKDLLIVHALKRHPTPIGTLFVKPTRPEDTSTKPWIEVEGGSVAIDAIDSTVLRAAHGAPSLDALGRTLDREGVAPREAQTSIGRLLAVGLLRLDRLEPF